MYDLAICNTFFQKKDEHMITYRSGTRQSTIDKWWNLKNEEFELKFLTQVGETIENNWDRSTYEVVERDIVEIARRELGESSGGKYVEKETWWWDQQVQEAVKAKKEAFKNWRTTGNEADKEIYKEHRKTAKISVTKAKDLAYEDMYEKLNTREGQTLIYKLANTRKRRALDIADNIYVNDSRGNTLTEDGDIRNRWSGYFSGLLNETNPKEQLQNVPETAGEVPPISVEEIRNQLTKMKGNKACGPDMIPIEVWKKMGEEGIVFLKKELNEILTYGIPSSWRLSEITPLFKGKGSILECSNYRGIKHISYTLKLLERVLDQRLRTIVELGNIQFGFRRGRSTMDPVFALKIIQEKYKEKQKDLHMIFVDLEKAYDRVPRDLIWWAMRKRAIPEGYVKVIQDMYGGIKTRVKTRCGRTEYFEVKVGLHQGSALSPLLFIIIMDVLAEEARTKPPWAMLFADDLVLVSETIEEVEEELERWRAVIENKGLRISRSKTEYLVPSHQQGVVKLEGEPLPSVNSFKYLGSVIDGSGGCGKDVDGRIKVAWSRWRDLSGVIYDKKVPMKLKSKLYKTVVRPAMVYGSECWALRKQEEQRLHTTEMKMLGWSQGKTRKDRIKNETIRGIARVTPIKSVLAQKRL